MDDDEFLGGFLGWYFTFGADILNCPHCGREVAREDLESSYDEKGKYAICPYCSKKIDKDSAEK